MSTKNAGVAESSMSESLGIGIRVLVNRAWGFSATSDLSRESVERTAMDRVIDRNASNYNKNIDAGGEGGIRTPRRVENR